MADLSSMSDDELMKIAGVSSGGSSADPSSLSDQELMQIAGIDAAPLTGRQKFAGGLANMIPLNFGDEIMAGIRTGADVLQGRPMGESYDANLAEIRQYERAFEAERPVMAGATSLAGNLPTIVAAPTSIGTVKGFWPTFKALATEGAAWGGAAGFGGGEGTLDRFQDAGESAAIGAGANLVLGGAAQGLGKLASRGSDDTLKQALDVQRSELKAARKFTKDKTAANPLMEAIRGADDRGVFSIGDDAADFIAKNEEQIGKFGDDVTSIIQAADSAPTPKDPLSYSKAESFVKSNPFQEEGLVNQLENRLSIIDQGWDGTLAGLNKLKQQLYKIAYKGTTESRELDQAIASDLRSYIESQSSKLLGPQAGSEISRLNKLQGQHLTLRKQLDKIADKDNMSGGLGLAIRRAAISPIGGAAAGGLYGLYTGDNTLENAAKGAGLGLLATRGGQLATSRLLKPVGEALAGVSARSVVPAITSGFQSQQKDTRIPEVAAEAATTGGIGTPQTQLSRESLPSSNSTSVFSTDQGASEPSVFSKLSKAVERVESAGKADAVSNKGAVGTHQVRPIAMREVMRRQGMDDSALTDADLTALAKRPGVSKQFGEAYLQMLIDQYDGDVELALAAYNAGPSLVDRLLKGDADSFADIRAQLPAETRAYVPKVKSIFEKA